MMATILHTGRVGAESVRFFRSPLWPAADWPWPDLSTVLRAIGLDEAAAQHTVHALQRDWPGLVRRFATAEGIALGLPLLTVRDLVEALPVPAVQREPLLDEMTAAMKAATAHLPTATLRVDWAMRASQLDHTEAAAPGGAS